MWYFRISGIVFSIFFLSPLPLLAQVYITEVMPNTDDDAAMEYIDIVNSGCDPVDISGYQIADKEKSYTFAAGSTL
ncbi:MAG: lamin tail domain-containing protein [Patescibacteria group bacterium]